MSIITRLLGINGELMIVLDCAWVAIRCPDF